MKHPNWEEIERLHMVAHGCTWLHMVAHLNLCHFTHDGLSLSGKRMEDDGRLWQNVNYDPKMTEPEDRMNLHHHNLFD